jgi:ATP-dependent DNA ligase
MTSSKCLPMKRMQRESTTAAVPSVTLGARPQSSVVEKGARALESEFRSSLESRHAACRQAFGLAGSRGRSRRALPQFVPPQLSQLVDKSPSGPQWVHEIKLDGYRVAARIDHGRVQLLTDLDWTAKYLSAAAALANLNVKTAYIDSEFCGVDGAGLPSFAQTQAATDGERRVHLVYYAFDLLHLGG